MPRHLRLPRGGSELVLIFLVLAISAAVGDFSRSNSETTLLLACSSSSLSTLDSRPVGSGDMALALVLHFYSPYSTFTDTWQARANRAATPSLLPFIPGIFPDYSRVMPSSQATPLFRILCPHIRRTPTGNCCARS